MSRHATEDPGSEAHRRNGSARNTPWRQHVKNTGRVPGFGQHPRMVSSAELVLREVFGLDEFRRGQADVVGAMLSGRDVLSVAPTGAGKSISYWVPAVVEGGLTMVVSPLIALMKDQVDRLTERGVAATFINSSVERPEQGDRLAKGISGEYRLVFLAPERLGRPGFMDRLGRLKSRRGGGGGG